jgi:hypothetical protein
MNNLVFVQSKQCHKSIEIGFTQTRAEKDIERYYWIRRPER